MPKTTQISETDAIRQVIADNSAMDYVDVVDAVQKRFRLTVTSSQVEEVVHELVNEKTRMRSAPRVKVEMGSGLHAEPVKPESSHPQSIQLTKDPPSDDLGHALQFVKSVHGLTNAKRALADLENLLIGS